MSWCATCDGSLFRDQEIVGGGDSAVDEATFLTRFASKVTIVHRRDQLRASKIMADRAANDPTIAFAWNSEIAAIHGSQKVTGVTLRDTLTGEQRELSATGVFVAIGHVPRTELLVGQVALDPEGYILAEGRTTQTDVAGIVACGDVGPHLPAGDHRSRNRMRRSTRCPAVPRRPRARQRVSPPQAPCLPRPTRLLLTRCIDIRQHRQRSIQRLSTEAGT